MAANDKLTAFHIADEDVVHLDASLRHDELLIVPLYVYGENGRSKRVDPLEVSLYDSSVFIDGNKDSDLTEWLENRHYGHPDGIVRSSFGTVVNNYKLTKAFFDAVCYPTPESASNGFVVGEVFSDNEAGGIDVETELCTNSCINMPVIIHNVPKDDFITMGTLILGDPDNRALFKLPEDGKFLVSWEDNDKYKSGSMTLTGARIQEAAYEAVSLRVIDQLNGGGYNYMDDPLSNVGASAPEPESGFEL